MGILAVLVVAVGAIVVHRRHRQARPQEQANLTPVPFTALAGKAIAPAFSPDGSQIAFAWNGDAKARTKGFDLYVKAIGSESLLRLTHHPSDWMSPAWSPDGSQIAFHRVAGADTGIYVVAALGGPERKLRSTRMPWLQFALIPFSLISWSPDGKWIAFSDELPEGGAIHKDVPPIHGNIGDKANSNYSLVHKTRDSRILPRRPIPRILVPNEAPTAKPCYIPPHFPVEEPKMIAVPFGLPKWG